ncbi:MAG: aminotransferase class V-fold PLP-dependent enzyme, partial [Candidatus Latescibacteria bacterium]|nr:aminotransferase class V-fold PLP-dependent enzyme [Candidatus Latescibacterota bacterium]
EAWGIDVVAADAHKWLLGPEGVALFCVSDRALDRIEVKEVGWSSVINRGRYLEYDFTLQPDARRFECGTPTTVGLYGLLAALELVNAVGIETISERIKHLGDFACQKADECGLTLFSARESELWSGIISLSVVSSASKIARELQQQGIVVAPRDGRIRLSPHYYNTEDEISHAITSISELDNAQEMA